MNGQKSKRGLKASVDFSKYKKLFRLRIRTEKGNEHIGYYNTEAEAIKEGWVICNHRRNVTSL